MRRLLLLLSLLVACGSGDPPEVCGVATGTPAGAATLTVAADAASFVGFTWGANNDCPAGGGSSVISITLRGHQADASDFGLGLCLPRPDLVGTAALDLGDTSKVLLVGAGAKLGDCQIGLAPDALPTGTVTFAGFCTDAGTSFLMTLSGQVPGTEQCGAGAVQSVTLQLGGQVLVAPQQ